MNQMNEVESRTRKLGQSACGRQAALRIFPASAKAFPPPPRACTTPPDKVPWILRAMPATSPSLPVSFGAQLPYGSAMRLRNVFFPSPTDDEGAVVGRGVR